MIFASDLDRTLIYSNRALEELGSPEVSVLNPVEEKDGNWVAYMTKPSYSALKELSRHHLFVPVTTRTTEQFNRFIIFKKDIPLKYAITTNGAVILLNGEPLEEWSESILTLIQTESVVQAELLSILQAEGFQFKGQLKQAEKLFFYYILEHLPSASEKKAINNLATKYGWRISLQGRKLYFIPKAITKGAALEFISNREGMEVIAGAGDSILDWDFLQDCRHQFVPRHGELTSVSEISGYTLTKKAGVEAGEEILQQFLNLLPLKI